MEPEDEQPVGALTPPQDTTAQLPVGALASIQKQQQAAYDDYAAKIRAAREQAVPSSLDRLSRALAAAGRPNRWGSTWVGLQQGLENWQQSGDEARKLQSQYAAQDAESELKKKLANTDLALKYATKTAPKAPALAKLTQTLNQTTGQMESFSPFHGNLRVPPGYVVLMSGQLMPYQTYVSTYGAGGVAPDSVSGGAPESAPAGTPTAAPEGAPAGTPTAAPEGAPAGAPRAPGASSPQEGAGWQQSVGKIVTGDAIGLDPNVRYLVKTTGPEAIKGVRMVFGDEAMRLTGGRYSAGQVDENGQFTPYSDKDRMPTPDELRTNLRGIQSAIDATTQNFNQVQALAAQFNGLTAGMVGKGLSLVWGTKAYEVAAALKTSVSAIALAKLHELKKQSATGASGLGSLTEKELSLLEASIAPLDQAQGPDAIRAAAQTVMTHYKNLLAALQQDAQRVGLNLKDAVYYQGGYKATAPSAGANNDPLGIRPKR